VPQAVGSCTNQASQLGGASPRSMEGLATWIEHWADRLAYDTMILRWPFADFPLPMSLTVTLTLYLRGDG
jgi:hypothetical protein